MAKASNQNGSDSEERKPGEQTGLDTRVVLAVNAASKVLHILTGMCSVETKVLSSPPGKYGRKTET